MPNIPFPSDLPFSVQEIRNEFDRLLDRVWHGGLSTAPLDGQDWAPPLDVYEHPDRFQVRVEMAGVAAEDVDVSILEGVLTVRGTKAPPQQTGETGRRLRSECRYGRFCRKFELPAAVQENAISASHKNGVLNIEVPKSPEVRGRSVKIDSQV